MNSVAYRPTDSTNFKLANRDAVQLNAKPARQPRAPPRRRPPRISSFDPAARPDRPQQKQGAALHPPKASPLDTATFAPS